MRIVSILLAETPPSSQMYLRPYKVKWQEGFKDALMESTLGGTNLSAGAVGNVAQRMLVPSEQVTGQAQIANGFGTYRLTVTMVIEIDDIAGRKTQEIVTGYSDFNGMHDALGRAVYAPEMRFFFNSVSNLSIHQGAGMNGYGSYQFTNSTQILTPLQGWDKDDQIPIMNRQLTSMRPKDTLAILGSGAMGAVDMSTMVHKATGAQAPVLGNTTYQFAARPKRSSRDNNVSSEYLSRVFTGFRDSMLDANTDQRAFSNGLQAASESNYINEPLAADSSLLQLLQRRTQYGSEWSVTLAELKKIDPTIEQRIQPIKMDAKYQHHAAAVLQSSEGWSQTTFNSQVAQVATTLIPNSMVKFALGMLNFHAHCETVNGSTHVVVLDARGVTKGIDPTPLQDMIRQHIATEIYPVLSQNGRFQVYIEADVRLNGISTITVGINGGPKMPFMVSTYCDAVYSPCLGQSVDALQSLASDIGGVAASLAAEAINSGPGIIRDHNGPSINYGNGGLTGQPLSNFANPIAPGNIPGGTGGLGF